MYQIAFNIYKTYNKKLQNPTINKFAPSFINKKLKEYANESLKKSIQKIEDLHKDPNYKNKLIVAKTFAKNNSNIFKLFAGATTISFSLYLVYSFMKRCRT
jgi:arginine/lysine/ornithine decarboxylase